MREIIEKHKRFVFFYLATATVALLVNVFKIKGSIGNDIDLFTRNSDTSNRAFWPFVEFWKYHTYNRHVYNTNTGRIDDMTYTSFHGIFYQFGVAEFIVYVGLLFGFLFYKANIQEVKKR